MSWENILKMPVSFDAEQQRDADYKQKIIDYEKQKIEPAFNKYIQSRTANSRFKELGIMLVDKPIDYDSGDVSQAATQFAYYIGNNSVDELGGNREFILNTLAEIYKQEGWDVEVNLPKYIAIKNKR